MVKMVGNRAHGDDSVVAHSALRGPPKNHAADAKHGFVSECYDCFCDILWVRISIVVVEG